MLERAGQAESAAVAADIEAAARRARAQFQDKQDLAWHTTPAESCAPSARRRGARRLAAQDAVDLLATWLRDLWVVGLRRAAMYSGTATAWPSSSTRPWPGPTRTRVFSAVAAPTRKDLYLNIDQKLALQAMFARFQEVWSSA